MVKSHDLKRMFVTAKGIIEEDGIGEVVSQIQRRALLQLQLFPSRHLSSMTLDGCTFDLGRLPNLSIKLALLKRTYEDFERRAVLQYVRPELPVVELGGCVGVVACITNKLLNNPSAHVVIEANPHVLQHLIDNRATNHCKFEVLNAAIAYDNQSITFAPSMDFWGSSLKQQSGGETVTIDTIRLRDVISERKFESFTLICDIEGYEYDLVQHEADVLSNADTIILETHARIIGEAKTVDMLRTLKDLGFRIAKQDSFVYVLRRSAELS